MSGSSSIPQETSSSSLASSSNVDNISASVGSLNISSTDSSSPIIPSERYSLEIVGTIKIMQLANGLRHGDYQRYRQYCSRRLRRLRITLHLNQPKNKSKPKTIRPKAINNPLLLTYLLTQSERSWSYAMQIRGEITVDTPRKRYHMLHKLSKACGYARVLERSCYSTADTRTQLQAEAYGSQMKGMLRYERNEHSIALQEFVHSKTVYSQLGKIGGADIQALCEERVAALEDSIRLCRYMLKDNNSTNSSAEDDEEDDLMINLQSQQSSLLSSKLLSLMQEKMTKQAASAFDSIEWCDKTLPIANSKIRLSLLTIKRVEEQIKRREEKEEKEQNKPQSDQIHVDYNTPNLSTDMTNNDNSHITKSLIVHSDVDDESKSLPSLYQNISSIYDEVSKLIKSDISEVKLEAHRNNLALLQHFVSYQKSNALLNRNRCLAQDLTRKLSQQQEKTNKNNQAKNDGGNVSQRKKAKPDELVLVYEKLLSYLSEMIELSQAFPPLLQQTELLYQIYQPFRIFYVAQSYLRIQKYPESYLLFNRVMELTKSALEYQNKSLKPAVPSPSSPSTQSLFQHLLQLFNEAKAAKLTVHALSAMESLSKQQVQARPADNRAEINNKKLANNSFLTGTVSSPSLLNRLDVYDSGDQDQNYNLIDIPPSLQPIACKPILFDLAFNYIQYPDIKQVTQDNSKTIARDNNKNNKSNQPTSTSTSASSVPAPVPSPVPVSSSGGWGFGRLFGR